jgi:hypothetical protein
MARKREKGSKYSQRKDAETEAHRRKEGLRLKEDVLGVAKVFG